MKKNGFTLVELLVAISILAVLTMIAIPTLRAFQNSNATKQYESYSASVASSAKLYNDSYSEDLFGNADSGCQKVMLTEMINKKVAKDIDLKDVSCNSREKDSFALIWKYKSEYDYNTVINCVNTKGIFQYNSNNEALAEACLSATGIPTITVNVQENQDNTTKKKSVIITLNDEFGFTANQEIEYAWSTINDSSGTGVTGYKTYKYNNSYIKRKNDTVRLNSNSITIPEQTTGSYYLYVKPKRVQNIINESITNIHKFGPFRFDHTAPTCPTITALKSDGTTISKNTASSISKFKIEYSADDLQNYEVKVSYDNGTNYSTATTYSSSPLEYVPTQDGTIKIMTRAKDYANNQSNWCTSDTYIRDTTPPSPPSVKGYKKNNSTDISSSSGLTEHATNTWLKGWIFTKASGSSDNNGTKYYYTATGATTNEENIQRDYRNVNADGTSTVKYKSCDNAGNCSGWTTYTAKLDRTAPTCGTATNASKTWTNSSRTIKQACTETSGSLCEKNTYEATYDKGTIKIGSITIKDKVGNSRTCTPDVYVDKDPPTCGTATNASKTWTSDNRTIKQACNDSGSECVKSSYDTTYKITTKTSSVKISDNAGNSTNCSYNVYVDKTDPTITFSVKSKNSTYNTKNISFSLSSTDSDSGTNKYCITTSDDCTPSKFLSAGEASNTNYSIGNSEYNGANKTVKACVSDVVGNKKCASKSYTVYKKCQGNHNVVLARTDATPHTIYWGKLKENHCNKNESYTHINGQTFKGPYAKYNIHVYDCKCHYDNIVREYCSNYEFVEDMQIHAGSTEAILHYQNNDYGVKACKNGYNTYTQAVCTRDPSDFNSEVYSDNSKRYCTHGYCFFTGGMKDQTYNHFQIDDLYTYPYLSTERSNFSGTLVQNVRDTCTISCQNYNY